jgi:hypothetical protein
LRGHPFEGHLSSPNPSFSLKGDYDDGLNEFPLEGGMGPRLYSLEHGTVALGSN